MARRRARAIASRVVVVVVVVASVVQSVVASAHRDGARRVDDACDATTGTRATARVRDSDARARDSNARVRDDDETAGWASERVRADGTTRGTFIARFETYATAATHEDAVRKAIDAREGGGRARARRGRGEATFRVASRDNVAATRFPTDFVVVESVDDGAGATRGAVKGDAVLETLRAALRGVVKDVHREQRLTRRSALGERDEDDAAAAKGRRSLLGDVSIAKSMGAPTLWEQGYTGAGVKMAVFDTGIAEDHPHFRHIVERTNWTNENQLHDGLGHGSFVAGVVAGTSKQCAGFAPDALIHTFRVFTNDQNSYTSWFLDGFNYAIATGVHVLNLSIGGPDYLDRPFTDKINEITAAGIIMISAIGNDGPLYGTLNNPADNLDIIGVGGITDADAIAHFSSRGMTTMELPSGYGRVKPDIVTYGDGIWGSKVGDGCRALSGTSVASPVAAGAAVLLSSIIPESERWSVLNPAVMKQALVEGATRIPLAHRYEQGAGKLDLLKSAEILKTYTPRASVIPATFDLTECPYAWPHCKQGIYATMMPLMLNATIVNGLGTHGEIVSGPDFIPNDGDLGAHLDVRFAFSETLWPYSGFLALYVRVKDDATTKSGVASGRVRFTVASPGARGETKLRVSEVEMTLKVNVVPTPSRDKRLLWDQFHNVRYPPGYIPRDNIDMKQDVLDWHGDHPHTNFHQWYDDLTRAGYFVEVLGSPFTCFDAKNYGALLLIDLEEEYASDEIAKLTRDVREEGLGLVVFADWYDLTTMESLKFFDDNTHYEWHAATGGANVPALNDLLKDFGIQFGGEVTEDSIVFDDDQVIVSSGTHITRAPAGAYLHSERMTQRGKTEGDYAFLSLFEAGKGRIFAFVDSNCVDSSHMRGQCFGFARKGVEFAVGGSCAAAHCDDRKRLAESWSDSKPLPSRRTDVDFSRFSTVLGGHPGNEGSMTCGPNAPLDRHDAKAAYSDLPGRLKVSESEKTSLKTTVPQRPMKDSRTTLDVKTDYVATDRADDGSNVRYYVVAFGVVAALLAPRARRRRARRARLRASGGAS